MRSPVGRGERRWWPFRGGSVPELARELDEEIELHLDLRAAALERLGLSASEARAEAIRRFGAGAETRAGLRAAALKRDRRMRMRRWLDGLRQDGGYAVRAVLREPALSVVIVVTLGLGIGANATMFGLIDRLLLRGPSQVESPGELRRFYVTARSSGSGERTTETLGYVSYATFRDATRSFAGVAAYRRTEGTVGRGASAEVLAVGAATADFFPLLGVRARLGRFPDAEEDRPPVGRNVAVLGYDLWRRRFGGVTGVIGGSIVVNDEAYTVIGVAPRGFTGVELAPVDVWLPMSAVSRDMTRDWPAAWDAQWLRVVGRLRPDVSEERAAEDATAAHRGAYGGESEAVREAEVALHPIRYAAGGREPLEAVVSKWLLAVTGVVLLIACANVMNLLLARSMRRRRELAVRLAMGVGRGRLFRLLLFHGLVLSVLGGGLALVITGAAGPAARAALLPDVGWYRSAVDSRVLLFTLLAVLLTTILTSAIPALAAGRGDLTQALKAGVREGGGRRSPLRASLTLCQITLTFVLLVGAGLFARSLSTVRGLDLGIEPDRVLAVGARWASPASSSGATREERIEANRRRRVAYYAAALERVRSMPGIASAAVAIGTPFQSSFTVAVRASGHDSIPALGGRGPYISAVTAGFFETVGLTVLDGRPFTAQDRAGSEPVAIVNRTMARTLWPGGALGECLYLIEEDRAAPCSRVIGVVEDAHRFGLREPAAMQYYIPVGQEAGFGGERLLVRPTGRPGDGELIVALREALLAQDPGVSFVSAASLQERLDPQVRPWKLGATLFSLFGGLALAIASIGLYGVIAYRVAERTHEMGVRKALGADGRTVLGLVLRHGTRLVAAGLGLGAALTLIAGRFVQPILFDTSARDPVVFAGVALLTFAVTLVATLVPGVRAGRVDPVIALRAD